MENLTGVPCSLRTLSMLGSNVRAKESSLLSETLPTSPEAVSPDILNDVVEPGAVDLIGFLFQRHGAFHSGTDDPEGGQLRYQLEARVVLQ